MRGRNTKGQGMSTNTVILLILGLVILVALIFGFATGWQSFKKVLVPTNVDDLIEDCSITCGLNQEYSYCSGERVLRVNEDDLEVKASCAIFAFSPEFDKYNIPPCPSINCDLECEQIVVDKVKGSTSLTTGTYDVSSLAKEDNCWIA